MLWRISAPIFKITSNLIQAGDRASGLEVKRSQHRIKSHQLVTVGETSSLSRLGIEV